MDLTLDCVEKGRQDNVRIERCSQGKTKIICKAEILKSGEGIETYRIVSIPYFKGKQTLALNFPLDLVYRKGTGKTYNLRECLITGGQARCQTLAVDANSCLEDIVSQSEKLHPSCQVTSIDDSRPLIVGTHLGTLVAQQSDTALVTEYKDKAIVKDPFILANSQPFEVWFGSERIPVAPFTNGNDELILPEGKFDSLERIAAIQNWKENWENFLPIHQRQILLLCSVSLQLLLTIPAVLALVDSVMRTCGYDLLPRTQRSLRRRYGRREANPEDPKLGETGFFLDEEPTVRSILQTPRSGRSFRSSTSRGHTPSPSVQSHLRLENQRALSCE